MARQAPWRPTWRADFTTKGVNEGDEVGGRFHALLDDSPTTVTSQKSPDREKRKKPWLLLETRRLGCSRGALKPATGALLLAVGAPHAAASGVRPRKGLRFERRDARALARAFLRCWRGATMYLLPSALL